MKRVILGALLLGSFSYCFGENYTGVIPDTYPVVDYSIIKDDIIRVFGKDFDKFNQIEGTINNIALQEPKVSGTGMVEFKLPNNISAGDVVVRGRNNKYVYGVLTPKYFDSNKLYVFAKLTSYLKSLSYEFIGNGYNYLFKIDNKKPYDIGFSLYNQKVSSGSVAINGDNIKISSVKPVTYNSNIASVVPLVGNRKLNALHYKMQDLDIKLSLTQVEKQTSILRVYFNVDKSDKLEVYLDGAKLDKSLYGLRETELFIDFDIFKQTGLHSLYVLDGHKRSDTIYFDLTSYSKPKIERFIFGDNKAGIVNKLEGKFTKVDYANITLNINGQVYAVSGNDYGKFDNNKSIIYGFHLVSDRYEFIQPFPYKSGKNEISISIKGLNSNVISFTPNTDYKKNISTTSTDVSNTSSKLDVIWSTNYLSGSKYYENKEFTVGNINFLSGGAKAYYLKSLVFELDYQRSEYLPYEYIKLGDSEGLVYTKDNKTYLSFSNIYFTSIDKHSVPVVMKLSDNLNELKLNFYPVSMQILSVQDGFASTNIKQIVFKKDFSQLEIKNNYSSCFDSKDDYSNCKKAGYKEKSHVLVKIAGPNSKSSTKVQEQQKIEPSNTKNTTVISEQKLNLANNFIAKIDKLITSKSNNDNIKKGLYKKIYTLIYNKVRKTKDVAYWKYVLQNLIKKSK